ncbi:MAG: O-antigen ligase [Colwellia sp.]|jgi:O-antigen ligase
MISNSLIKKENFQLLLTTLVLLIVTVFFAAQPIHRPTVISSATILWLFGLVFLPYYWKNKEYAKKELILYALGAISFFICLASWLNSPYFDGTLNTLEPDARLLLFPLTVIAVRCSGLTFQHLAIALLGGAIAYAWVAYTSTAHRVSGDENAVTFGNGAALLFVTSSCLVFFEKQRLLKIFLVIASMCYFYATYRSGTRGSYLAFIPLVLLSIYFLNKKQRLIMILVLFIAGLILSQSNIADRLAVSYDNFANYINHQDHRSSTGQRLDMWHAAWCFNQESPLIGKGPHQFKELILDPKRSCEISVLNSKQYYVQAHSFYFNAIATVGWLGLISILLFFGMTVQYAWTLPLIAKVTIPAVIITFLSYSITVDLLFQRYMADKHLTLLAILFGLSLSYKKKEQEKLVLPPDS